MPEDHSTTRFLLWAGVGVAAGLIALIFGVPGLVLMLVLLVVAATRSGAATSAGGVLLGIGLPLVWFGYEVGAVDRECTSGSIDQNGVETCTAWMQTGAVRWPWLLAAAVVIGVGVWLHVGARRRQAAGRREALAARG